MNAKMVNTLVGLGTLAFGGGCLYVGSKVTKMTKKVGMAVDDLSQAEAADIQESMIRQSVEKAASKEVRKYANEAGADAIKAMKADIHAEVKKALEEAQIELRQAVTDEISDQAAKIDIDKLQKEIIEKAEKKVLSRVDIDMDGLLEPLKNEIRSAAKLRSSFLDALDDFGNKDGLKLRIGT